MCYELVVFAAQVVAYYRVPHRSGITELVSGQSLLLVNRYLSVTSSGWLLTSVPSRSVVELCPYIIDDEGPLKVSFAVDPSLELKLAKLLTIYGCALSLDGVRHVESITTQADLDSLQAHLERTGYLGSPDFLSFCLRGDNNLRVVMEIMDTGHEAIEQLSEKLILPKH
jgi:hypothetical protein